MKKTKSFKTLQSGIMINSIFPIVICLLSAGMCRALLEYDYEIDCIVHEYDGGPGQVIATFEPTLPGEISLESSSSAWDISSNIVSGVPVVGGALSSMFSLIGIGTSTTIENMQLLEAAINELIRDINETIYDLKDYVDAKFDEYDYDIKVDTLHGILYAAGYCAGFNQPNNQEECLKSLNIDIVELVPTFFPVDPKYETFEQLLPLTRHYIDLQMAVLVDIINLTDLDQDYVDSIATFSIMAYNFYVTSVETIVQEHITSAQQHTAWWEQDGGGGKPSPFCLYAYFDRGACTQEWDHGDGCQVYLPEDGECGTGQCFTCSDSIYLFGPCMEKLFHEFSAKYSPQLAETIRTYWEVDMGQAMENYKKIGIMAGASEEDYLVKGESSFAAESYILDMEYLTRKLEINSRKYLNEKSANVYQKLQKPAEAAEEDKHNFLSRRNGRLHYID